MQHRLSRLLSGCVPALLIAAAATAHGLDPSVRYDDYRLARITVTSRAQLHQLQQIGARSMACRTGLGVQDFLVPPDAMKRLDRSGVDYVLHHENVQTLIDAERNRLQPQGGIAGALELCDDAWFADFRNLDAINARIDLIVAEHGDIAEKLEIGTSIEGRTIFGLRISSAPADADVPAVLISGCQHAREWVAPMMPVYLATTLACSHDTDADVQELLQSVQLLVVPVVNPDGYLYSWGPDRFWRKNRRDNGDGTWGVDLNRNWDIDWNGGNSTSTDPDSDTYVGTAPFSEPETQAMRDFVLAHDEIVAHIDFHSYGQLVLQPWGWTTSFPPDYAAIDALGSQMSAAIFATHGFSYPHGQPGDLLYFASGLFPDWCYDAAGIFGYTIELRPEHAGLGGFELPPAQILPTCQEGFAAVGAMLEWAASGVTFDYPQPVPEFVQADQFTPVQVAITPTSDGPLAFGTTRLVTRIDDGPLTANGMLPMGSNVFQGSLPAAACGSTIEYYFQTTTVNGNTYASPGDDAMFEAIATSPSTLIEEDFEAPAGWVVENSPGLIDGAWDLGVPAGAGDRGDPVVDGDGSGACYLTDNTPGNSDIDGGSTTLISPPLDATEPGAAVRYLRWFSNDQGTATDDDPFTVEISGDNGQSWLLLEELTRTEAAWVERTFIVADHVAPTAELRLRFTAADFNNGSVVEAAVDAVAITINDCGDGVPEDVDGSGDVDVDDLIAVITAWGPCVELCPADVNGSGAVDVDDLVQIILAWSS